RGLGDVVAIVVSPDGKNVYVASSISDAVAIIQRDAQGNLTQRGETSDCVSEDATDGNGKSCVKGRTLMGVNDLAISADGNSVYTTADGSPSPPGVAVFDRGSDGMLTQKPEKEGCIASSSTEGCGTFALFNFVE